MSAIDKIIDVYAENVDDSEWVNEARAELAELTALVSQLRAERDDLARQVSEARIAFAAYKAINGMLEEKLEQARWNIEYLTSTLTAVYIDSGIDKENSDSLANAHAWLAANPPAE